jgi:predicted RNA-binding protein with PUA-like domain
MSRHWLVKSEPAAYSWTNLLRDDGTAWTGVRNFAARNHLRAMRRGDFVLFYHSVTDKQIVGLATVARAAFPDPTAKEGDWSAVELKPSKPLTRPVTLGEIKADDALRDLPLLRQSRLSVMPLSAAEFKRLLQLGQTKV